MRKTMTGFTTVTAGAAFLLRSRDPGMHQLAVPLLLGLLVSGPAGAIELPRNNGGLTGNFDTTISVGATVRTTDRNSSLVGTANGGTAHSINSDNGNLNYDKGDFVSTNAKITHELQLRRNDIEFFARAFYFYDQAVMNGDTARTELSDKAKASLGRDFVLRDVHLTSHFDVGSAPVTVRLGNQVMSWGESVFIRNGLNSINPIDVSKFRIAGAEIRDGLEPIPALNVKFGLSDNFSVESFYQFQWSNTEIEPEGSFFSTNDFISPGGRLVHLGFGVPGSAADFPVGPNNNVPRAADREARDDGQFGLALRIFAPALNETEFGLYYSQIHSRLPVVSGRAVNWQEVLLAGGDYASQMRYFREFPEDIRILGGSFNTTIGNTGLALQGELAFRQNQPLQVDDAELLFSGLSPLCELNRDLAQSPQQRAGFERLWGLGCLARASQLGPQAQGAEISGFRRKDVVQAQIAATKSFGPQLGSDQLVMLVETGVTQVQGMESKAKLRYDGPGTTTSANPLFLRAGMPAVQTEGFADPFSWGYRALLRAQYNNAIGAVSLTPQIAFSHDVAGTTPSPIGNFVEDRKTVSLSLAANYLNAWQAKLSYTNSFGGGDFNLSNDRDFLAFAVNYSF